MIKRCAITAAAGVLMLLAVTVWAADGPAPNARLDPNSLIYTFFPVTLLQAFVGISDDQAAKISAIDTKMASDRAAVTDSDAKDKVRIQASKDVKAVLLPAQVEKLAECALELQILTNTLGRNKVENLKLTPSEMTKIRPIMETAVAKYLQINQERDQALSAISAQATPEDSLNKIAQAQQERELKIVAMRAIVKTSIAPILTDEQKATLGLSPAVGHTVK